ncbi:hypothetical protein SPD48_15225 [Pseudogracilibacillus sp. SE30717A]|uniref:hypothetical protein n=1 Tax=Pseudogracilibacillus sp. SE30717A TaxID=3098293 RepID=UPI00300E68A0
MQDNRKELYNLSNQMMDIFIKDIFSNNKIDLVEAKSNISEEQREALKNSVNNLKEQVESFLYEKNAKKTITENDQDKSNSESPLREMFRRKNQEDKSE